MISQFFTTWKKLIISARAGLDLPSQSTRMLPWTIHRRLQLYYWHCFGFVSFLLCHSICHVCESCQWSITCCIRFMSKSFYSFYFMRQATLALTKYWQCLDNVSLCLPSPLVCVYPWSSVKGTPTYMNQFLSLFVQHLLRPKFILYNISQRRSLQNGTTSLTFHEIFGCEVWAYVFLMGTRFFFLTPTEAPAGQVLASVDWLTVWWSVRLAGRSNLLCAVALMIRCTQWINILNIYIKHQKFWC